MKKNTRITHLGRDPKQQQGFVNPPTYRGSTVIFEKSELLATAMSKFAERDPIVYGTLGTPTIMALEDAITELEGGAGTILTPSGLSAITLVLQTLLRPGDHMLVSDSVYGPTRFFCDGYLAEMGINTTYYEPTIGAEIKDLIQDNTKVIFTEAPGSLSYDIADIPAICQVAKQHDICVVQDNTWGAGLLYPAIEHGVDISIHALTKYPSGHADILMGSVSCTDKYLAQLRFMAFNLGLIINGDDASLMLRSLRSLPTRLAQHAKSALYIATELEQHPLITHVMFPALPSDPNHQLWLRDFKGANGLFSIVIDPRFDRAAVCDVVDHMQLFGLGFSWGGYESLVSITDFKTTRSLNPRSDEDGIVLRLSIGLEDADDLLTDLKLALARLESAA